MTTDDDRAPLAPIERTALDLADRVKSIEDVVRRIEGLLFGSLVHPEAEISKVGDGFPTVVHALVELHDGITRLRENASIEARRTDAIERYFRERGLVPCKGCDRWIPETGPDSFTSARGGTWCARDLPQLLSSISIADVDDLVEWFLENGNKTRAASEIGWLERMLTANGAFAVQILEAVNGSRLGE